MIAEKVGGRGGAHHPFGWHQPSLASTCGPTWIWAAWIDGCNSCGNMRARVLRRRWYGDMRRHQGRAAIHAWRTCSHCSLIAHGCIRARVGQADGSRFVFKTLHFKTIFPTHACTIVHILSASSCSNSVSANFLWMVVGGRFRFTFSPATAATAPTAATPNTPAPYADACTRTNKTVKYTPIHDINARTNILRPVERLNTSKLGPTKRPTLLAQRPTEDQHTWRQPAQDSVRTCVASLGANKYMRQQQAH